MDIPHVDPTTLRSRPDQFCEIFNRLVDEVNTLRSKNA